MSMRVLLSIGVVECRDELLLRHVCSLILLGVITPVAALGRKHSTRQCLAKFCGTFRVGTETRPGNDKRSLVGDIADELSEKSILHIRCLWLVDRIGPGERRNPPAQDNE